MKKSIIVLHIIVTMVFSFSCAKREKDFRQVNDNSFKRYEDPQNILWSGNQAVLKPLIHNSLLPDIYDIYLLLEIKNDTNIFYYLVKDTDKGNYVLSGDSLYVFNKAIGIQKQFHGWYEFNNGHARLIDSSDAIKLLGLETIQNYLDVIEQYGYGIYKLDGEKIRKVGQSIKEQHEFKSNEKKEGIYYDNLSWSWRRKNI